jgi:uncharacterized membrane protein
MRTVRTEMGWLLGLFFVMAGVMHFAKADQYARIVPPYLPWPNAIVAVSGVAEIALGLLVLVPRFRVAAAWGLVALLVAVFPANVHMAIHTDQFPEFAPVLLWIRLPMQALLIAWAYWFTRRSSS